MKRFMFFATAALSLLVACNKAVDSGVTVETNYDGDEIVIGFSDSFDASVETRTTAISNTSNFPTTLYWGATTGTSTETAKWAAASASVNTSGSTHAIATGKYQNSNSPVAYNYYVTNISGMSVGSSTTLTVPNNNTDVICGRTAANSTTTPGVTLEHIFCRTGSFSATATGGYSISNVSWTIKGTSSTAVQGTAGTYNLTTGTWTSASTKLNSATPVTSSSDMYLIPGQYTVGITYTLTMGEGNNAVSQQFTKTATVNFPKGKICNVSGSFTGDFAAGITITVSVQDWVEQNFTPEFS